MNNILDKTYTAITHLPVDEQVKENYRERASRYFNECGCSSGSFYLILSLIFSIIYTVYFDQRFFLSVKGILIILGITVFGKLVGKGIARMKLFVLFNSLNKHAGSRYSNH